MSSSALRLDWPRRRALSGSCDGDPRASQGCSAHTPHFHLVLACLFKSTQAVVPSWRLSKTVMRFLEPHVSLGPLKYKSYKCNCVWGPPGGHSGSRASKKEFCFGAPFANLNLALGEERLLN